MSVSPSPQCCAFTLVRFRHRKHLVGVRKTSWSGLKHFLDATNKAGNALKVSIKTPGFVTTNKM